MIVINTNVSLMEIVQGDIKDSNLHTIQLALTSDTRTEGSLRIKLKRNSAQKEGLRLRFISLNWDCY